MSANNVTLTYDDIYKYLSGALLILDLYCPDSKLLRGKIWECSGFLASHVWLYYHWPVIEASYSYRTYGIERSNILDSILTSSSNLYLNILSLLQESVWRSFPQLCIGGKSMFIIHILSRWESDSFCCLGLPIYYHVKLAYILSIIHLFSSLLE